ncbi:hypothetical protein [Micromonospora coerulea]|uniref:hypothetical protein n=1 Tax=Micromonospora coerulea TaxID=47856 RepID=UPI00190587C8|nr:hypothetical protein [Micromonospora veneta]
MSARGRRIVAAVLLAGLAPAGCGPATDSTGPGGGSTTATAGPSGQAAPTATGPTPGPWPNPSARPVDRALRTGMRIGDDELMLSPSTRLIVDLAWFDTRTGRYHSLPEDENFRSARGEGGPLPFFEVRERPAPDGRLITFGFASARVARATITQPGYPTTTLTVAPWGRGDVDTSLFWAARPGRSLAADLPAEQRAVCTLYDPAGRVLARLVLTEAKSVQKGG